MQGATPCDDGGRDQSKLIYKPTSTKIAGSHQRPGERHRTDSSSGTPEGTNLARILILDF